MSRDNDTAADLDRVRATAIRAACPDLDDEAVAALAWSIREADDAYGVIAVPKRPTIAMVFEAQRVESGDAEFDALAPRMFEWYEVMLLAAIENSPYRLRPRLTN